MEASFHIRKASERDIPFLVESVIAAEKSGTETLSYSAIIKANVLSFFLGKEKVANAATHGTLLNTVHIEREIGALQLESFYTCNKFRGRGVSGRLIEEHICLVKNDFSDVKRAQILLAKTNDSAYKAYHIPGFYTVLERKCTNAAILELLPTDTMILMQKEI
jgi:hypothetical protein